MTETSRIAVQAAAAAARLTSDRLKADVNVMFAPALAAIEGEYAYRVIDGRIILRHIVMAPLHEATLVPDERSIGNVFHELLHAARKLNGVERPFWAPLSARTREEILASVFSYCVAAGFSEHQAPEDATIELLTNYFDTFVFAREPSSLRDVIRQPGRLDGEIASAQHPSIRGALIALRWLSSERGLQDGCSIDFFRPWFELKTHFQELGLAED